MRSREFLRASSAAKPLVTTKPCGCTRMERCWISRSPFHRCAIAPAISFGASKIARNITLRKQTEALIECQKDVLELVVNGAPLEGVGGVLDFLARSMERQSQGALIAIHLMEADGWHFGYVAAPSLPAKYAKATKGMDARQELGCCSSAVVSHTPTIVRDFADPVPQSRWPDFSAEIISLGLRGCFTTPILSADEKVLGTFAIYYREPRDPSPHDRQLVQVVTRTVALAIERKQAEQALRESEARFRNLADTAPATIWVTDPAGSATFLSRQWYEYTGQTEAQALGLGWLEAVHPDDREESGRIFLEANQKNEPFSLDYRLRRANGEYRWAIDSGRPRFDAQGNYLGFVGSVIDVHDRRHADEALRESEERFRAIADNIPQLAWMAEAGSDGQANWFNKAWLDYTGTTMEQNQGSGWQAVHHPDHAERVIAKFEHHVRESLDWEDTFPLRAKDGTFRWFLSRMNVIRDESGTVTRIFGTNTDITAQRTVEQALRESEHQTKEQAASLADLHRRKDEFLAMLSHELRNPLAPIVNAVQLLRLQGQSQNAIEQQARDVIERQVGQLTRLIDDLLEVSRITSGRIRLRHEQVTLNGIVERATESVRPLIAQRRHELTVSLPPQSIWLNADAARLEQVVVNLLNNAAKYTDDCGFIWLTVEQQGDEAVLRVRDTGVGIAPELLPRIFDLFTQAERSLDRAQGGLGIGLSLVQRLVELHGGRVAASSAPGQGSEFVVRLPIMQTDEPISPDPAIETTIAAGKCRVLVVDDNLDAARMMTLRLKADGHEVRTVHDGETAIKTALRYRPDVMLLDIGLPGLDGYEVARQIRQEPTLQNIVLVAMTGYGQDSDRLQSREAGFDHHLVKPAETKSVQAILAVVAEKKT